MKEKRKLWHVAPTGLLVGFLAGLFGAGGGMIAVPALRWLGLPEEEAHATSLAVMLPLAIGSSLLYWQAGSFQWGDAWGYWPGGIIGAIVGALLLPRIKAKWLRYIFGAVLLVSAVRLLTR